MKCDELKVHKAYNRWIDEEMPTHNDDLICNEVYLKDEVDAAIAELKQKLQDQCISCPIKMQEDDVVAEFKEKLEDAGMRERRLRRALYKALANWAMAESYSVLNDVPTANRWVHTLRKLKSKLEAYK